MAPEGHHVLEISTICPYQPFKQVHEMGYMESQIDEICRYFFWRKITA